MEFLDANTARIRMNEIGHSGSPFLFVIDYEGKEAIVQPLEEINSAEILYHFPEYNNDSNINKKLGAGYQWKAFPESFQSYRKRFDHVIRSLKAGNSYLVNLTCRVPLQTSLSTKDIYCTAKALYKLWVKGRFVCFSPETFIRIGNGRIFSHPMKGTADADQEGSLQALMENEKEAAEHATVVDLIRNDLSMVAHHVTVNRYRYAECLHTNCGNIYQTSSEISGILPSDYQSSIGDIVFSQLPAGSITGAPKPSTCRIISEAEETDRGFYTGIMGICAYGMLDSAVMIRFVQECDGQLYYRAGGGITAKSQCIDEYNEMIQKIYVPVC